VPTRERSVAIRLLCATLAAILAAFAAVAPLTQPAGAAIGPIPTPCDIPGGDLICDVIGKTAKTVAGEVASATADFIMRGVTAWVTNAAVWVTGKVGELINATASPNVQAAWFQGQYRSMITVAGALALPLLLLAVIQAVWRQDVWILLRSAFAFLPMAFILAGAAIVATQLVISITDDLAGVVVNGLGGTSSNLLQSVGDAYKQALDDTSGTIPLFGIFLGAIILAIGAFVLWLEMVIRDAAIYIALFFLPLTFVAMIWPATTRWARRLVELLIAIVLAKFVIVSILSLATAAITNTTLTGSGSDNLFERMIAGSALLVLAAWSPFALLRLIPMMEVAAASVTSQRAAMASAAGSAGIQTPAAYMRQAMDRHSRASTSPPSSGEPRTVYVGGSSGPGAPRGGTPASAGSRSAAGGPDEPGGRVDAPSEGPSRATHAPPRGSGSAAATETRREERVVSEERRPAPPPPPESRARPQPPEDEPPEAPRRRTPPPDPPRPPRPPRGEE